MFKQILVPLDGSTLAEAALPPAVALARCFDATLTLVHVIERNAPEQVHGERHLTSEDEACAYLGALAQTLPAGIPVETHTHSEEVSSTARGIADHILELNQDLVVMCAHGASGLKQWMVGSIAQQVIGLGRTPVLLIQPEQPPAPFSLATLLAALDNNPDHRCGLQAAAALARAAQSGLRLLTVVHRPADLGGSAAATARLLPGSTALLLEMQLAEAQRMLDEAAAPFRAAGQHVTCAVRRGEPAAQIAAEAAACGAGVIVLGTHGRAGMGAFWAGSVAPRLPGLTRVPLLLVPTCGH